MKKIMSLILTFALVGTLASCGSKKPTDSASKNENTVADVSAVKEALTKYMPDQMKDGVIKVAVVRNLPAGDHTQQFLDGCTSEGEALGFVVDTFVTDGDNAKCQEVLAQVIEKDYDGIIVSHAEEGYAYDSLLPAVQKGMKVVTFDSIPYKDGTILEGVTSTAQEDAKLAELSLQSIVDNFDESAQPIRVVRAWMGPGIPPLDRRQAIYDRYVQEGKIQELELVGPIDYANARGGTQDSFAAILPKYPVGQIDAVWGSYDELAKGCLQALEEAGRTDVKIMSIDISNDDINLMLKNPDVWVSTAAVDPKLIGISNIRLLAAKFVGEETPELYNLDAQSVKTTQLDDTINMSNIVTVVDGWGQEKGVFDSYAWMSEIKTAVSGK